MAKKIFAVLIIFFLLTPAVVLAKNGNSPQITTLTSDTVVDKDYFAAGEIVEISGTVNGDVYTAGGQVLIDGTINGDLIAAGGSVTISGDVLGNIRTAGGQVLVTGNVGKNATVAGGNVEFTDTAVLNGNLVLGAGSVVLNAPVSGDINAGVGNLRLSSNASVGGDINYASEDEISLSETASVSGTVQRNHTPEMAIPDENEIAGFFAGADMFAKISSLITSLVLGILLIKFFPNYSKNASEIVVKKFLPSLGIGFLGLIATPILIVIIALTVVGIPLALFLALAFFLYLYLARLYAMLAIGQKIADWTKLKINRYWIFLAGLVIYYLLTMIPVVGWLIKLLVLVASFGAALKNEKQTWQKASKASVV